MITDGAERVAGIITDGAERVAGMIIDGAKTCQDVPGKNILKYCPLMVMQVIALIRPDR
jgi:hypothetical protein